MPNILHIETSTEVCSVALSTDGVVKFHRQDFDGPSHAALLGGFVEEVIAFARQNNIELHAIAVSGGPGSYTGLRIGVSEAKGLCFGMNLPLIAVSTLELLCCTAMFRVDIEDGAWICPMIDARRMEVYAAVYDECLNPVMPVGAYVVDENTFADILSQHKVIFCGNGADKCREVINHPNAIFVEGVYPLASNMLALAERAFAHNEFSDVAYYEPFYLKEFVATTPKNKVF
ncbi:MAG: tRNA (adenosine(37)-N6)-threonylcarbamoyltransferase complex dimerization subunit type 1 TsaB [Bacteroidaceae bacterium]|nr:tRNA (adenosine(37)-N6)-threonylcarbamoyltransferase complex dimerization subunit type 1 TsaB [Bacteroidaceae bacterium]